MKDFQDDFQYLIIKGLIYNLTPEFYNKYKEQLKALADAINVLEKAEYYTQHEQETL